MNNTIIKFSLLVLIFINISSLFSVEAVNKYKPISKSFYPLRIYVFTSTNDCSICNMNINPLNTYANNNNCEFMLFLSGLTNEDAESLKKQRQWNCNVIGDVNDVYKDYFNINRLPEILLLNNEGVELTKGKLGGSTVNIKFIDSLLTAVSKIKESNVNKLKEIKRISVTENGKIHFTNHLRELLFVKSKDQYIIRERAIPDFYIADSVGNIFRDVNQRNNKLLKGCKIYT